MNAVSPHPQLFPIPKLHSWLKPRISYKLGIFWYLCFHFQFPGMMPKVPATSAEPLKLSWAVPLAQLAGMHWALDATPNFVLIFYSQQSQESPVGTPSIDKYFWRYKRAKHKMIQLSQYGCGGWKLKKEFDTDMVDMVWRSWLFFNGNCQRGGVVRSRGLWAAEVLDSLNEYDRTNLTWTWQWLACMALMVLVLWKRIKKVSTTYKMVYMTKCLIKQLNKCPWTFLRL